MDELIIVCNKHVWHSGSEAMFADLGHFSYSAIQAIPLTRHFIYLHLLYEYLHATTFHCLLFGV